MAKIDVTTIEGYENLTAEEKLAALEGYEFQDNLEDLSKANKEVERLKNSINKLSSENADWKRKYNEKLSDEEKATLEAKEKQEQLEKNYQNLLKEKELNNAKANFLALGYSEELANETAQAQLDGDFAKVMENQKKFIELHDKDVLAKAMNMTPPPKTGDGNKGITLEELRKLSATERYKFAKEHPDEYNKLYE